MKRTIVVPDATRSLDYHSALDGLAPPGATVIVALGLHRPMKAEELQPLRAACDEFGHSLIQHDPDDVVGRFAPAVARADEIICVGVVEPHQYAGFSGGVKGVAIGCASRDTIAEMHSLPMLNACQARVGWFEGNPFQERLRELVSGLPITHGRFFAPGTSDVFDGEPTESFRHAVESSRIHHFREVEPVDSMLLRVPPAKAVNFYQASRAATYVALAHSPAIKQGGTIYVEAACPEGVGTGPGEVACAEAMGRGRQRLLAELRSDNPPQTRGGEQRAYVLAMALERCDIVLVGPPINELAAIGIEHTPDTPDVDLVVVDPFHRVVRAPLSRDPEIG